MQQEPPAGTPWWAWLLVVVLVLFVLPMSQLWANQRKQGREQKATAIRLARVDHQVTNEHQTNLRDDVDVATGAATRGAEAAERAATAAEAALERIVRLEAAHGETRKDIGGIREEQREQRKEMLSISTRIDEEIVERRKEMREVRETERRMTERLDEHLTKEM